MASVRFEKGSKEWLMFLEYWELCKKFWIPEENDNKVYWDSAVGEVKKFCEKYQDIILAEEIALAFLNYLKKKNKEMGR